MITRYGPGLPDGATPQRGAPRASRPDSSSWRITPVVITHAFTHPDRAVANRARNALMEIAQIDVATIEAAIQVGAQAGPSRAEVVLGRWPAPVRLSAETSDPVAAAWRIAARSGPHPRCTLTDRHALPPAIAERTRLTLSEAQHGVWVPRSRPEPAAATADFPHGS